VVQIRLYKRSATILLKVSITDTNRNARKFLDHGEPFARRAPAFTKACPGTHFKPGTIAFAAAKGVPFASFMVPFSGIMELAGGIMILIGYEARTGVWLIVFFMIPVTFIFHQFWKIKDPMQKQMEMATFLKNISILGGALILTYLAPAT